MSGDSVVLVHSVRSGNIIPDISFHFSTDQALIVKREYRVLRLRETFSDSLDQETVKNVVNIENLKFSHTVSMDKAHCEIWITYFVVIETFNRSDRRKPCLCLKKYIKIYKWLENSRNT